MSAEKFGSADGLLGDWLRRVHMLENCHYETSSHYKMITYLIGVPATILSAFAGTSVFVSLTSSVGMTFKVVVGAVSVLVAVLTGLQTFLRSDQLSERHLVAGRQYGVLRQEIEQTIFLNRQDPKPEYVTSIRKRMEAQTKESLEVPRRIFNRVKSQKGIYKHIKSPLTASEVIPNLGGQKVGRGKLAV